MAKRRGRGREIVLPGDYLLVTVRVLLRRYLLKPDRNMKAACRWILGHYAEKHGVRILAVCFMSTHYHAVVQDVLGVSPNFLRDVNRSLACVLKTRYGFSGKVFEEKPNKVVLKTPEAVAEKIAYTLANPVAAGAVRNPHEWPGFRTRLDDMGKTTMMGTRPELYFGKRKTMPKHAQFEVCEADCLVEEYGRERANEMLKEALERHVNEARAAIAAKGWKYLGASRAEKANPFKQATQYEVFNSRVPRFSTFGMTQEEAKQCKRDYVAWQEAYDDCRRRFLEGETGIVWPAGTWAMVQFFGQTSEVRVAAA